MTAAGKTGIKNQLLSKGNFGNLLGATISGQRTEQERRNNLYEIPA
jgi:hypothetical protein